MKDIEIFEGERALHYDEGIRKWFPLYDALQDLLFPILNQKLHEKSSVKILVAGSGTGNELLKLAEQNPAWNLIGVDPSAQMNTIAREKLKGFSNVRILDGRIEELGDEFDVVISLLVTHFFDTEAKAVFYKNIFERLKEDGRFILADIVGNKKEDFLFDAFEDFQRLAMDPVQAEPGLHHIKNDVSYIPEENLLHLLKSAGFNKISSILQWLIFKAWVVEK